MHDIKPSTQHEWLRQLIGEWEMEAGAVMGPDQPEVKSKGRESVKAFGEFFVIAEGSGEWQPGDMMYSRMTLGYDPSKGKFVGTWVGTPMTNMWVYEGELDASGKVLTLDTEGPDMSAMEGCAPGEASDGAQAAPQPLKLARYQDIIEIVDANTRKLRSQMQGADGNWTQFMEATYTRVG
jgi:hypothetical protein